MLCAMICWVGDAQAQSGTPGGATAPETRSVSDETARLPVDVTGATFIDYDARTQEYIFRGPIVVIVRGAERLEAPEVRYDAGARRAILPRRGILSTPTMRLEADRMTADLATRHFLAEGAVEARFLDAGIWTSLRAQRIAADDRSDLQEAEATGDVVVIREDEELRGDRVIYNRGTRHATVEGHATFTRGIDRFQADRIVADIATRDVEATGHLMLDRASQGMHGSADRGTYSARLATAVLSGGVRLSRGRDLLTADKVTVRLDSNEAIADGHVQITAYPGGTQPAGAP
jgi:lipopolysaccharide export system protein LptA